MYSVVQTNKLHRVVCIAQTPMCLGAATSGALGEGLFCNKCNTAGVCPWGGEGGMRVLSLLWGPKRLLASVREV